MAGVNKVILIGNVGQDPEIRDLPSGSKVANFSLATSETYTDRSGQRQTQTEWHRLELWERLAEIAQNYIKKGDPLYVEGKIKNERWTDKDGVEKTGVRIRVNSIQLLGSRSSGDSQEGSISPYKSEEKQVEPEPKPDLNPTQTNDFAEEDDLPF